jgi:hypothetical protein
MYMLSPFLNYLTLTNPSARFNVFLGLYREWYIVQGRFKTAAALVDENCGLMG